MGLRRKLKTVTKRRLYGLLLVFVALLMTGEPAGAQVMGEESTFDREAKITRGTGAMVVAANPYAARIGAQILKQGGSAADAAIATALTLSLVEPQSSGLGGGGFALTWESKNRFTRSYDGRETAPASVTPALFESHGSKSKSRWEKAVGGRSVGIPGLGRMLEKLHKEQGKLPLRVILKPIIKLAHRGYRVSPRLHKMLLGAAPVAKHFPKFRRFYYTSKGKPLPVGYRLRNPDYAKTLRRIARKGFGSVYQGWMGYKIRRTIATSPLYPAVMSKEDLRSYRSVRRAPVCGFYRAWKICSQGPPSSGATTLLAILRMLETQDLQLKGDIPNAEQMHVIAQSIALAYADRAKYLTDPAFADIPVQGLIEALYARERVKLITDKPQRFEAGNPPRVMRSARFQSGVSEDFPSTSHLIVRDKDANLVTMTTTIQSAFGSFLRVNGMLLNNELTDFSWVGKRNGIPVTNRAQPGKRPRSSMSPTLVFDASGNPVMALGSAGGSRIITHVLKVLIASIDWKMPLDKALSSGNFHSNGTGIDLEKGSALVRLQGDLEKKGYRVRVRKNISGLTALRIDPDSGTVEGSADPRREGIAVAVEAIDPVE